MGDGVWIPKQEAPRLWTAVSTGLGHSRVTGRFIAGRVLVRSICVCAGTPLGSGRVLALFSPWDVSSLLSVKKSSPTTGGLALGDCTRGLEGTPRPELSRVTISAIPA